MLMKKKRHAATKSKGRVRSKDAVLRELIRLEKRVWDVAQRRDAKGFRELVPEDGVMIFQSGIVRQPDYIATMKERTISDFEIREIHGFMPNATTGILMYEAVRMGEENGKKFPLGSVIESTTWIKRGRKWVAILNQETPIQAG
jgi:hypothetical protein